MSTKQKSATDKDPDPSNMRGLLKSFPDQFEKGLAIGRGIRIRGRIERVVVAGMGGSSLPADIVDLHLGPLKATLETCRDYVIRGDVGPRTLVLASSFSGNTEETLSAFRQAVSAGARTVAITSGGQLGLEAAEARRPIGLIPESPASFQPRLASGYFFAIYAGILEGAKLLPRGLSELESLPGFLRDRMSSLERQGKSLARKLRDHIALFYAPERYARSVARINKIKINENAKSPAFWNAVPELNHNEMQGFQYETYPFHFVFLEDTSDGPEIRERFRILGNQLRARGYRITRFEMPGETDLQRAFAGMMLGDWASYHLALLRRIDPTPVELIEEFKKKLKRALRGVLSG